MSFFDDVGNFFGGIFGQKKKEDKPAIQQQNPINVSQQNPSTVPLINIPGATPVPVVNIAQPKLGGVNRPPEPTVQKPKSFFDQVGDVIGGAAKNVGNFANDAIKNTGGMINDFNTDPNNVPRNVIDYVTGYQNPLDGATLDYSQKDAQGRPLLVPKPKPTNIQEYADQGLGANLINELLIKPTVQAAPRLYNTIMGQDANNLPQWIKDANTNLGYKTGELQSNFQGQSNGISTPGDVGAAGIGTLNTVGDVAALIPLIGGALKLGIKGVSKTAGIATDAIGKLRGVESGVTAVDKQAESITAASRSAEEVTSTVKRPGEAPTVETPVNPSDPITTSPTTNKAPAITSANFDAPVTQAPQMPQAPKPFFPQEQVPTAPQLAGIPPVKAPVMASRPAPTPINSADEVTAAAQKAIDEATVNPPEVAPTPIETAPSITPAEAQAIKIANETPPVNSNAVAQAVEAQRVANAPTEAIAKAVPQYKSPNPKGKASVGGISKATYTTGDPNLDGIVHDSIIAHKGSAPTAEARGVALDSAGVDSVQRAKIRDIATHNVDRNTGKITADGKKQIEDVLTGNTAVEPTQKTTIGSSNVKQDAPAASQSVNPGEITQKAIADGNNSVLDSATNAGLDVSAADKEVNAILQQSKDTLESGSYGKLVVKQAKNSDNPGNREALTSAEQAIVDRVKPQLDTIREDLNARGLTDVDMGYIAYRNDYLPTTAKDELTAINNVEDVANKGFAAANSRAKSGKGLTDLQQEQGAEQALRDYLRTGELVKNLSPDQVKAIKLERRNAETVKLFEQDSNGNSTGLQLSDQEVTTARTQTEKVVDTENAAAIAEKRVADGDTSKAALSARDSAQQEAVDIGINKKVDDYLLLEKKTDARISEIRKDSSISPDTKKQLITQLESHLKDIANNTYYLQSTVRTNLLLGVGRIADQANKGVQAVTDVSTGLLSKVGANKSFNKSAGRDLYGDKSTSNAVWNGVKSNPALNKAKISRQTNSLIDTKRNEGKGFIAKAFGKYRVGGTTLTEAGSRYKIADKDATSYFTAKAQSEGITDTGKIIDYVNSNIGSKEWDRVHRSFFDARNSFTGIPTKGSIADKNVKLNVRTAIYDKLGSVPGLSRSMRENIADGITIPLVGFPKLIARLGIKGLDTTMLGARDFFKAAKINPTNDAEALQKALYVQSGIRSAQSGAALGALGVTLGASNMITGAYPSDPNERARWQRDKIQPFSLKLGDQYVDLGRYMGPLAFPIMIGATIGKGNPLGIPETTGAVIQQMLHNYGADSIGNVMTDVGDVMTGKKTILDLGTQYGAGIVAAFVPAASLLNTGGKAQDMVQGNAQPDTSGGFVDKLRAKFPVTRNGLPGKTDTVGDPITQGNAFNLLPGVSGGQNTTAKGESTDTTIKSEIDRLSGAGFETMPTSQNTNASDGKGKVISSILLNDPLYQSATDEQKAGYLKDVLAGTSTKDISLDISATGQQALMDAKILGDKKDAWLDDNTNNANYQTGMYDNAKAMKTLTEADKDITNAGGLLNKSISATVARDYKADYALKNEYKDTSQGEFKALLNPKSDTFSEETAQRLYNYDQARVKAGLPPKYNLAAAKKAAGGGGSKGFSFASLPSSLLGKSASGGSGKYSDGAPLFKPMADLSAPVTVAIPMGRNISVKRGVQL